MSNSVLNTFYMLFKSDTGAARADIDALDKKIENFRAKGKQRTHAENEEMRDLIKTRRQLNDEIKGTQTNTEKLIQSATQAATAYVSFGAIKAGLLNAQQMNRELTIQSDLWGQNANTVAAYGAAVKAAGGSAASVMGWYEGIRSQNAAAGMSTMNLDALMDQIHGQIMRDPKNANMWLAAYGVTDPGQKALLQKPEDEYRKAVAEQKRLTAATADGAKASQEFGTAMDNFSTAMTNLWTVIGADVLPLLTDFVNTLTDLAKYFAENKDHARAFFGVMLTAATGLSVAMPRLLLGFTGLASGAVSAAFALSRFVSLLGVIVGMTAGIGGGIADIVTGERKSLLGKAARKVAGWIDPDVKTRYSSAPSGDGSAMDFWMSQGYTREQAAAWVATELAESSGNPRARGDGGRAHGLFQHHPDRRAAIFAATGIDMSTASAADQRRAAAWEAKNGNVGFNDAYFRSLTNAGDAAAYITSNFERPADIGGESIRRAQSAMSIASNSSFGAGGFGGKSQTINVGEITVNTQAKDPNEVATAISNQLRTTYAQFNDSTGF